MSVSADGPSQLDRALAEGRAVEIEGTDRVHYRVAGPGPSAPPDPFVEAVAEEATAEVYTRYRGGRMLEARRGIMEADLTDAQRRDALMAAAREWPSWGSLAEEQREGWRRWTRPVVEALERGGYLAGGELRRFRVKIDDPDMASAHTYEVAALTPLAAIWEGARRACLDDPHPMPSLELNARVPRELRENPGLIDAVAMYGECEPLDSRPIVAAASIR